MIKNKSILISLVSAVILMGCSVDGGAVEGDRTSVPVPPLVPGIYEGDGTSVPVSPLVSYDELVERYGFDISQDDSVADSNSLSSILEDLGISQDITFKVPDTDKIGSYKFAFAENLIGVDLPDTIREIGEYAFYDSGISEIDIPSGVVEIKNNTFDGCPDLKNVTMHDGIKKIGVSAFRYDKSLSDITIPDTVEQIGASAFEQTGLEYVLVPEQVSEIDDSAFISVDTVCYGGDAISSDNFGANNLHKYTDGNVCVLCNYVSDYSPYTITGAEFIEDGKCDIPETFEKNGITYKVVRIGESAFYGCDELISLKMPKSIEAIEDSAFDGCKNLKEAELNESLVSMGRYVFSGCESLEEIVIPDGVSHIYGCFIGCTELKSVTLPREIGLSVNDFNDCTKLETIHYRGTKKEWENLKVEAPAPIMEENIYNIFDDNIKVVYDEK